MTFTDPSADVIDVAVESGILLEWARVTGFEAGRFVRIERPDTDELELTVRTKDIRRAIRRTARDAPARLGLDSDEVERVSRAIRGLDPITPEVADTLIQIAATGRAQY